MTENQVTEFVLIDQLINELKNVLQKVETLKADLERITAERNQLVVEIKDLEENKKNEIAIRDAEIDKLKNELQRETAERKATVDLLRDAFSHIQNTMNSVQQTISLPPDKEQ